MKQLRQFIAVVINDHVHVLRSSPCLWYMQRKSDSARLGSQVFKIVTSPFEPLWKLSKPLHCISTTHVIVFVRARARACESNQILSRESESVGPPAAPAGHQGAPLTVPPAKFKVGGAVDHDALRGRARDFWPFYCDHGRTVEFSCYVT